MVRILVSVGVLLALLAATGASARAPLSGAPSTLPGFKVLRVGPNGGTVWEGRITNRYLAADHRLSLVYLPPGYSPDGAYRVVYFLHGFWGAPSSFVYGLHFAEIADREITTGRALPFIAVMPPGGPMTKTTEDEWAGVWENYVVRNVIPWVDSHLATDPTQRSIAGLSAGGYGAVDIGLRHPELFDTMESWGGYFQPFLDGPFAHATRAMLDAHTPTLLVRSEASTLRRREVRFFLSTGRSGHGDVRASWTFDFARELARLRLMHRLWVLPDSSRGHLFRAQLPAAIDYASP